MHTFRKRQSSLIGAPRFPSNWGQAFPNVVAFLNAEEERFAIATGALNLNSPMGGSAKGIPSHFSTSPLGMDTPRKVPVCKWMSKSWAALVQRLDKRAENPSKYRKIILSERTVHRDSLEKSAHVWFIRVGGEWEKETDAREEALFLAKRFVPAAACWIYSRTHERALCERRECLICYNLDHAWQGWLPSSLTVRIPSLRVGYHDLYMKNVSSKLAERMVAVCILIYY